MFKNILKRKVKWATLSWVIISSIIWWFTITWSYDLYNKCYNKIQSNNLKIINYNIPLSEIKNKEIANIEINWKIIENGIITSRNKIINYNSDKNKILDNLFKEKKMKPLLLIKVNKNIKINNKLKIKNIIFNINDNKEDLWNIEYISYIDDNLRIIQWYILSYKKIKLKYLKLYKMKKNWKQCFKNIKTNKLYCLYKYSINNK